MTCVNKVFLIGFVGADVEVRYTPAGEAVANFTIGVTERWKQGEEQKENTEWCRIVLFRRLAEIAGQHLKKGSHVCIQGRLRTRKWTDKEGIVRYTTEVLGTEMQMLGRAPGDGDGKRKDQKNDGGLSEMEDDIPF